MGKIRNQHTNRIINRASCEVAKQQNRYIIILLQNFIQMNKIYRPGGRISLLTWLVVVVF